MPSSGKGCNLILRPSPEVSLGRLLGGLCCDTNKVILQQKAIEERMEDFQNMLAFPYCSQTENQSENQKQKKPKEIPIVYETTAKGDGPWYILEKLRKDGETEVHAEKLYRIEKNGDIR